MITINDTDAVKLFRMTKAQLVAALAREREERERERKGFEVHKQRRADVVKQILGLLMELSNVEK